MKQRYPKSLNCWLRDYPKAIKITLGREAPSLGGPWEHGSIVYLRETPLHKDWQGTIPTSSNILPILASIYSDTGSDDFYNLKVEMEGFGTFHYGEAPNFWLEIERLFRIYSGYNGKVFSFHSLETVYTGIPKTLSIPNIYTPPIPPPIFKSPPPPPPIEPPPGPIVIPPGPIEWPIYTHPDSINHNIFALKLIIAYHNYALPSFDYILNATVVVSKTKMDANSFSWSWVSDQIDRGRSYNGALSYYGDCRVLPIKYMSGFLFVFLRPKADIAFDIEGYDTLFAYFYDSITQNGVEVIYNLWNIR
jgi:hypothetical protein